MKKNSNSLTNNDRISKPGKARGPVQRDAKEVMAELVAKLSQRLEPQPARTIEGEGRGEDPCLRLRRRVRNRHEAIGLDDGSYVLQRHHGNHARDVVGREKLADFGIQASITLVLVSAPPALMAIFTAPSIGSLKGTSIRSRPCS